MVDQWHVTPPRNARQQTYEFAGPAWAAACDVAEADRAATVTTPDGRTFLVLRMDTNVDVVAQRSVGRPF
jgi:hypothetical protein